MENENSKWSDFNNEINNIFEDIIKKDFKDYPLECPRCKEKMLNFYIWRWDEKNPHRGGIWIWCSKCNSYYHATIRVPEWWENCSEIDTSQLTAIPKYLEENKEIVRTHLNKLLNKF